MIDNIYISAIAAITKNKGLGKDGKLLFRIPEDFARMKSLTMGHPIIMGRKTYESIGRPLSGRLNIVISRDISKNDSSFSNLIFASSLESGLNMAKKEEELRINNKEKKLLNNNQEIFIFGGGEVYKQALPLTDRLYLTVVDKEVEADTFFPDYSEFTKVIEEKDGDFEGLKYTYLTLER